MALTPAKLIPLPRVLPDSKTGYPAEETEIANAISRAQENLLRQQHPDGHWCGELVVDSTLCSDFVLFMHWLGEVDDGLQQR
jgi:squalene-hopene/tetraprenyl-beta-curcumene cyclase